MFEFHGISYTLNDGTRRRRVVRVARVTDMQSPRSSIITAIYTYENLFDCHDVECDLDEKKWFV